jgi:hypothetical protein
MHKKFIILRKQDVKKASLKSISITTYIISHKAKSSLTINDHHIMATVITTHTFTNIITQGPKPLNVNDGQRTSVALYTSSKEYN